MSEYEKVINYIKQYHMFQKNDSVIVGLSGGADSVCLTDILWRYRQEMPFHLVAVHLNHGIRGEEALRDEAFVKAFCREREIEILIVQADIPGIAKEKGLSLEEAGRIERYRIFEKVRAEYGGSARIAVAHHVGDQAETFLYNLCRGTGLKGLAGIRPVNGHIIRPVLCLLREEIENYLGDREINYVTDSTNLSDEYTRNRIRHQVLPYLTEQINAGTVRHIESVMKDLWETEEYLQKETTKAGESLLREKEGSLYLDRDAFAKLEPVLQKRLVRLLLERLTGNLKDISRRHVEEVVALVGRQTGRRLMLPYGIRVENEYGVMKFMKTGAEEESHALQPVTIEGEGQYRFLNLLFEVSLHRFESRKKKELFLEKYLKNPQKMYTKCFDYDKINNVALLRTRKTGDFLVIDRQGNQKKLKSYFIDEKIPAAKRDKIPCLADGSHILWVYGHRISEYYKVTQDTERILKVTVHEQGR